MFKIFWFGRTSALFFNGHFSRPGEIEQYISAAEQLYVGICTPAPSPDFLFALGALWGGGGPIKLGDKISPPAAHFAPKQSLHNCFTHGADGLVANCAINLSVRLHLPDVQCRHTTVGICDPASCLS